ncbi:MAG TPA: hypothetical protein VF188_07230 [Longimicrobiales bacterium]
MGARSRTLTRLILAAALALAHPLPSAAQQRLDLDRFQPCEGCAIEPVLDLRLGEPSGARVIETEDAKPVYDDAGYGYAVYTRFPTRIKRFDARAAVVRTRRHYGSRRWESDTVMLLLRAGEVLAAQVEYDERMAPRVVPYRLDVRPTLPENGADPPLIRVRASNSQIYTRKHQER